MRTKNVDWLDYTLLVLIVVLTIFTSFVVSGYWDEAMWRASYDFERYKVQAIEVHILAVGFALALEMGFIAAWLDMRRRGGQS